MWSRAINTKWNGSYVTCNSTPTVIPRKKAGVNVGEQAVEEINLSKMFI